MTAKPKIFVFCNRCSEGWHSFSALTEDGCFVAGHVCSHHLFAYNDMGVNPDGWKHEIYRKHYPDGYEVVFVEDAKNPGPEFNEAYARHRAWDSDAYRLRMSVHDEKQ